MKLVSTAYSKEELKKRKKDMNVPSSISGGEESYPWGSVLELDDALLEKLGLNPKDFEVGGKLAGQFEAEVTSLGQRKVEGKSKSAMTLQIVRLGLESEAGEELSRGIKAGLDEGKAKP